MQNKHMSSDSLLQAFKANKSFRMLNVLVTGPLQAEWSEQLPKSMKHRHRDDEDRPIIDVSDL